MTVTLTWQTILLPILVIAAIVAVIYLCMVLAKLLGTLKKLDPVLDDVKNITAVASEQTDKAGNILNGMEDSMSAVVSNLKANKGMIKNVSSVVGATTSIIGVAKSAGKNREAKVAAKARTETGTKTKKDSKKTK